MIRQHPFSYHFIQECVSDFLDTHSIVAFSSTNRSIRKKLLKRVNIHKQTRLNKIFSYFYKQESFKLSHSSWEHGDKIKYVLLYLPELFLYIQEKNLNYIDLGLTNNYGGYPQSLYKFIPEESRIVNISSQLLNCLKTNKTVTKCNLGLFERHLDRDTLLDTVQNRPNLDWLSLRSNGATTRFTDPPHTIYIKSDGKAVWSHFRPS